MGAHFRASLSGALFAAVTLTVVLAAIFLGDATYPITPRELPYALSNLALFSAMAFAAAMLGYLLGIFIVGLGAWPMLKRVNMQGGWAVAVLGGGLSGAVGLAMLTSPHADGLAPLFGLMLAGAVGGWTYQRDRQATDIKPPPVPPA